MACDVHMLRSLAKLYRLRLAIATDDDSNNASAAISTTAPPVPAALLLPARVRTEAPAPGWRPPPPPPSSPPAAAMAADPDPPALLRPLGYMNPTRLATAYLASPCPWGRWLAWHLLTHCPPLPQAWLPSLHPAATPTPEAHPAVWRLDPQRDIPLSAVDFHVSNVVDETLTTRLSAQERRALHAALRRAGLLTSGGGDGSSPVGGGGGGGRARRREAEAEEEEGAVDVDEVKGCLRSAMWRFSSSVTDKAPVGGEGRGGAAEGEGDGDGLQLAWAIVEPHAHAYARAFIKRRCSVML